MERRTFIASVGLVSAGLMLANKGVAAVKSQYERLFVLPKAKAHVRHGLFNLNPLHHRTTPKWIKLFESHLFFADGVSEGDQDMLLYSFELDDTMVNVSISGPLCFVRIGDDIYEFEREGFTNTFVVGAFEIEIVTTGNRIEHLYVQEGLVLPLSGNCRVNGSTFETGEFAHLKEDGMSIQTPSPESMALCIKRIA